MITEEIVSCFKCGGHGTIKTFYNRTNTSNMDSSFAPITFSSMEKCSMCKGSGKLIKVIDMCYKPLEE